MVMMSFKIKRVLIPVKKKDRKAKLERLKKELGKILKIYIEKEYIVAEGEDLKDYKICDKIYDILEV